MLKACYGKPSGPIVTPEEFITRGSSDYKNKGIFPYCTACEQIVEVYGVHSLNVPSRFNHANRDSDSSKQDCCLADRSNRFVGMEPDSFDLGRGIKLRNDFFEDENLITAYAFCLNLCRKGNLNAASFKKLIQLADVKNIWQYAEIPIWTIPYMLLSLGTFKANSSDPKKMYDFHFAFHKPNSTTASALWKTPDKCNLKKVFSDGGKLVKTSDNPYPISQQAILDKCGNTDWIKGHLLQALKSAQ